jgi:hypothetical protein
MTTSMMKNLILNQTLDSICISSINYGSTIGSETAEFIESSLRVCDSDINYISVKNPLLSNSVLPAF